MSIDSSPACFAKLLGEWPVWTPEIETLAGAVCANLRMDLPGMAVYGFQRTGKTTACNYLLQVLSDTVGVPLGMVTWRIPGSTSTEVNFLKERLLQSGCKAMTTSCDSRLKMQSPDISHPARLNNFSSHYAVGRRSAEVGSLAAMLGTLHR